MAIRENKPIAGYFTEDDYLKRTSYGDIETKPDDPVSEKNFLR
jgi:hypothetical protein